MRLALSKLATIAAAPAARRGLRTVPKMASPLATSAKVFGAFNIAGLGISLASDTHVCGGAEAGEPKAPSSTRVED